MKTLRNIVAALLISVMAAGCTALQSFEASDHSVAITYGTLKVIERDNGISDEDVLRVMDQIETLIQDEEVIASRLREETLALIGFDKLDAADRFLVITLLDDIENSIKKNPAEFDSDSQVRIRLSELVDYVRRAAMMAG